MRIVKISIIIFALAELALCIGCLFPFQIVYYLAVGWFLYLNRVIPEIQVNWSGVATAVVCLALLAVGLHWFLRWLSSARAPEAKPWPFRWTATILSVVVLVFVAGIAVVGITHQTAWIATSPEPIIYSSWEAPQRIQTGNQLHQLAIGLLSYADDHNGTLPAHAVFGCDGQPLLSWRVLILPYIEEEALFCEFRLDEPWDSPHNMRLLPRMPKLYAPVPGKRLPREHATHFQVFIGTGAAFEGRDGVLLPGGFPDGTSNTILIVEAADAVPWTKPADMVYSPDSPLPALGSVSPKFFVVAMADGSVRTIYSEKLNEATLRGAITRNGGEILGDDW
jgi:hypothetical protein